MLAALAATLLGIASPAAAAPGGGGNDLELYEANVDPATAARLVDDGYDVTPVGQGGEGVTLALVLAPSEQRRLESQGVALEVVRDSQGRTQDQRAARQEAGGFNVWRDYDGRGGIEAQIRKLARKHAAIAQLRVIGQTTRAGTSSPSASRRRSRKPRRVGSRRSSTRGPRTRASGSAPRSHCGCCAGTSTRTGEPPRGARS